MDKLVRDFFGRIDFSELDNAYSKCAHKTLKGSVHCCQSCFMQQFFNQNRISYSCIHKQRLYVVRLLPVHVKEIELALNKTPDVFWDGLNGETVKALLLGGGPGVESIAIRNVLRKKNILPQKVLFMRTDIEKTWDGVAGTVVKHFHPDIRDGEAQVGKIKYKYGKVCVDLFETKTLTKEQFNIITLSYFVSEIPKHKLSHIASLISQKAMPNTVVVINDREELKIIDKAIDLCIALGKQCKIECITASADIKELSEQSTQDWLNGEIEKKLSQLGDFKMQARTSSDIHRMALYSQLSQKLTYNPKSRTQSFRISMVINK